MTCWVITFILIRLSNPVECCLSGVELNKPTHFTVSTKGAGKANLDCSFSGPTKGEAVKDFEIINNHDNTHTVKYTPVQQVREECSHMQLCYVVSCGFLSEQ